MKTLIDNKDNLTIKDITDETVRVKALIVNENNEILLGYSFGEYQFPGGHVEGDEELTIALHRELFEETGMNVDTYGLKPFLLLEHLTKDWPEEGNNRLSKIYYYIVESTDDIHLNKTNYTIEETIGNFELRFIPLEYVEELLIKNSEIAPKNKVMATEMLEAIKEYRKITE